MNRRMILAKGEVHHHWQQKALKKRAHQIASEISKQKGIIGILLSGSVARGPVGPSSDLDLHIVVLDSFIDELPEWSFRTDGTIENLHRIPESLLGQGWNLINQNSDLAFWFYQTRLGDELNGYEPIFWDPSSAWSERLPLLLSYRTYPSIVIQLSRFYIDHSSQLLLRAQKALNENAIMDAHQELRWAVQTVMIAALIQRGWIIRGSKKRIEIAKSFFPDPVIKLLVDVALNIVGLNSITRKKASEICQARLIYRDIIRSELYFLLSTYTCHKDKSKKLSHAIKVHEQHNAGAFDYYQALIQQGLILGPINHIRTLSSFSKIPTSFLSYVFEETEWPIDDFLSSPVFSDAIKNGWLRIAELTTTNLECCNWIEKLYYILNKLSIG